MSSEYRDKVVVVTGGAYGIGRAAAIGFAQRGAKVAIADTDVKNGEETLRRIREAGGEAIFVKTDVSSEADVEAFIKKAVGTYGRLDCAFNNAGIHKQFVSTVDFSGADWDEMINVNLKSVWLCMKYEIPHMLKQGKGAIVNTSSAAGLVGAPSNPAYPASKHGVVGITKSTAPDLAGIRPKLQGPGQPFRDFVVREESDRGRPGWVNLVGIESPGLTCCLEIGRLVAETLEACR
jgi:NAD(P)-dependent dehydrogenase (short-subunit alcohol dehydrogenase family)